MRRAQGAFEYILLLGGILLIVVVAVIILRNSVLNQANKQVVGNVNAWQGITSATCPNVPCGEGKGCYSGKCYPNMLKESGFESGSATLDSEVCAPPNQGQWLGQWNVWVYSGAGNGCYAVSSASYSGSRSFKLRDGWAGVGQWSLSFSSGETYGVSFWYKTTNSVQFRAILDIGFGSGDPQTRYWLDFPIIPDGQWHYVESQRIIDLTGNYVFYVGYPFYGVAGPVYLDDIALVKLS